MYDLKKADNLYNEELSRNSSFDHELIMDWRTKMPESFARVMFEMKYGCHIFSEDMYEKGLKYITDNDGKEIELWSTDAIKKIASEYIDIDDEKFYSYDLYLWANVKKADLKGIEDSADKIIKIAIAELKDKDYPYCPADERAYHWLEAHEEKMYN